MATTITKQAIGIDMAKDKFDVCFSILNEQQHTIVKSTRQFKNNKGGFAAFDAWVRKMQSEGVDTWFVMEATGVYYENLAWHLHQQGRNLSVVLPNLAKKYLQSLGYKSKNDKIDAKGLARMGTERQLQPWQPLSEQLYLIRKLTREREQLVATNTSFNNILHAEGHTMVEGKSTVKRLKKVKAFIDKQMNEIEQELLTLVDQDPVLKERLEKVTSIKGVGFITAITIIAETNGFELFTSQRQLVSYAGYDVVENQSGKRQGSTKMSRKGNSHIRRALFMPAFQTVRYELPVFVELYTRLIERGKKKMQAYVALQKKLLVLIYTLWKKDEKYDEKYQQKKNDIQNQEAGASLLGCCAAA